MNSTQDIRLHYPYPIAKLYEAVRIENEPHQRVRKLVDLYERTAQYLALAGLALYRIHGLRDEKVEALRPGLELPGLGHWVELLKALSGVLRQQREIVLLTAGPAHVYGDEAIVRAMQALAAAAGGSVPKKPMLHHFLDLVVQFRNKKSGHGILSTAEVKQVLEPLEAGLVQFLGEIAAFRSYRLLHVAHVEWSGGHFVCSGTNLDVGTSLDGLRLERETPVEPQRVLFQHLESGELYSLHPFFFYETDLHLLYLYSELNPQGRLLLRCPYEAPGAQSVHVLDLDRALVVGAAAPAPAAPPAQVAPSPAHAASPAPARDKGSVAMRSWFDIIQPHEDIRRGNFDEAVFAADLGDVVRGDAPPDYCDPGLFFRKTYLTGGLQHLLARVHDKLALGQGQSVIEIQTPFGGGKTHSLVTVYHYLKHGSLVRKLLPPGLPPSPLQGEGIAVIVGTHHNPVEGETSAGINRRTLWGELAFQLAGEAGYRAFAENDQQRVSPGKARLKDFLAARQPFILLFDEILEYVNRAAGVAYEDTTLASQTFAFFQELTETVAALPRGMMVVTLPSSYLEDYGERQEESLARLNKIFGRVENIETPVQGEEVYAVIRRRLFDVEGVRRAEMNEVIYHYLQVYNQYGGDLPAKVRSADFKRKMELAYPFHPDVIDILYEKWSTFSSFQRTRGVLRLLAGVVEDLYAREVHIDLILPGDLNLARPAVRQEFLKHVGPEYEGVIGSDIAGHEAKAQAMDRENRSWKHLAERVSTAIFFHSFSADDSEKGISLPYIKLAALRSDTLPSMVTEVLGRLSNALWYLNSRGDVHYFSRIPNLNRMILGKKELFNESYAERLREIIRGELGSRFTAYLWPESGDAIPDNRALKLVVLRPDDAGGDIPAWVEHKGETFRVFKNTLFFALADTGAFVKLREDVKTLMALEEIRAEVETGQSGALVARRDEIQRRMHALTRDFSFNVRHMYHTLQAGGQRIDLGQPVAGNETLSNWYWRELEDREQIATRLHYRMLVNKFLAGNEQVSTQTVLDQFYKEPGLPALPAEEILARALQLGVQEGAFGLAALAEGAGDAPAQVDPESLRFQADLPLGVIAFEEGLVLVERRQAEAIAAALQARREAAAAGGTGPSVAIEAPAPGPGGGGGEASSPGGIGVATPRPEVQSYRRVRLVIAGIPASRIADANRGILMPINRDDSADRGAGGGGAGRVSATCLVPRWAAITREERFFTCMLLHDLRQDPGPAWAILGPRLGCAGGVAVADVGFEVCFFRDMAYAGLIERHPELEKQTFDLVLTLSDQSLVIIEAKAQQSFGTAQTKTLHRARDIMQTSVLWPAKQIYLVGLCSSRCTPRPTTRSQLDGFIHWCEMVDAYPNQQAIYMRADEIYRDRGSR